MKGLQKKILLGLCGIFLALATLIAVAAFYLESGHARKLLEKKLAGVIPGSISWGDTRISIVKGLIVLDGVQLKNAHGDQLVFLERLLVDIAWQPLLKRELVIQRAIFSGPKLKLDVDRNGSLNLVRALVREDTAGAGPSEIEPADKGFELPFNVIFGELALTEGTLSLALDKAAVSFQLGTVNLEAQGNLGERSGRLSLQATGVKYNAPNLQTTLDRIDLEVGLQDGRVAPLNLTTGNEILKIVLTGTADRIWDQPSVDLSTDFSAPLSLVKDLLSVQPELTGTLSGRIHLQGTIDDPLLTASLNYGGGVVFDQAIDGAHFNLTYKNQSLVADRTEVRLAGGQVGLRGRLGLEKSLSQIIASGDMGLESARYELDLNADRLDLEQLFKISEKWRGLVSGTVTLDGQGLSPDAASANIVAEVSGSKISGQWVEHPVNLSVKTSGQIDAGVCTLEKLEALAGPVSLSASGRLDLTTEELQARLTLDAHDLDKLVTSSEITGIMGQIHVEGSAAGTLTAPVFEVDVKGEKFRYQNLTVGDVVLVAGLDRSGVLRVSRLGLKNQASTVRGKGSVRLFDDPADPAPERPIDFVLELEALQTTDFFSPSPVDGRFDGKLTVSGTLSAPEASLTVTGKNVSAQDNRVGDIDADLSYAHGTIDLRQVTIENQKSTLELSGSASLLDPSTLKALKDPKINVAFGSKGIYLDDISPEFKGTITARGNISGSLSHPRGDIEIAGRQIDFGVQAFEEVLLSIQMDGDRFDIQQLTAVLQGGDAIRGTGWVSTDKGFGLDLSSTGISLEAVANGQLRETVSGKLVFAISGSGTLDNPQLKGTVSTTNLHLNGKVVEDADLLVNLEGNRLQLTGRLTFDIDGTLDIKEKDFRLTARFENTDLVPYFKVAGQPDLSGAITGSIRADGNLAALDRITADAEIGKLAVDFRRSNVLAASDVRLSFAGNTLTVPPAHLVLPGGSYVDVSGTGRLDGPLDFKLDGNIPLSAVSLLTDQVSQPSGQIKLAARLKGTPQAPDLAGDVRIENAAFIIEGLDQKIGDIQGKIQITSKEILLETLEGRIENGHFGLTGRLGLDDLRPTEVKLTLAATALPIEIPGTMDLLLSSNIEVSGTLESVLAKGEVVLLDGTYYKDVNLNLMEGIQSLTSRRRGVAVQSQGGEAPFLEQVKLNIAIKRRNPLIVENNLANLEIHPDLVLRGTLKDPLLNGRADIKTGTVNYGKTAFDIQKGVIDFNNPYKIEPKFDIVSEAQVRDWLITLAISGTPDELDLKLTSDPPLGSSDIGSLLLFGKTSQEVSGGGGPGSEQSASNMLAELLASRYAGDIKKMTGLDVFEVRADSDSSTQEENITVTVGKEISERMTLKYTTESTKGEFIQRAIAEYKVLENLLLRGFQDTSGSFGGSVKYRLEFR